MSNRTNRGAVLGISRIRTNSRISQVISRRRNYRLSERLLWFEQDEAFSHLRGVRDHLDTVFPNCWIDRRGAIEWPPRFPNVIPMDCFLLRYLNSNNLHKPARKSHRSKRLTL